MKGIRVLPAICCALILTTGTSCGSNGVTTAGGGAGGTGISQGPITGFGSVFVNGVEFFSTTGTVINKNGTPSSEGDLGVGMVVTVQGSFDSSGMTGDATQIDFNDNLEGPVQSINTVDQSLGVMGQTVKVDTGTHYQSDVNGVTVAGLNDLQAGNVIEVSGFIQADGTILATYLELKSTSCNPSDEFELKGIISNLDSTTFQINNLTVNYSSATLPQGGLSNEMFVEVKTTACYNGGDMIASEIEVQDSGLTGSEGSKMELEGFVTQFNSPTDFVVNAQPVSTTDATVYESGNSTDLANNVRVEVEGQLANGILIANKISFDD